MDNFKLLFAQYAIHRPCVFFVTSTLLFSSTRKRYQPQRPFGKTVVTGVFPPPPPRVPAFVFLEHRVLHSHCSYFYARRFSSHFASSRSRARRSSIFKQEKIPTSTSMHSARLELHDLEVSREIRLLIHRARRVCACFILIPREGYICVS